MYDANALMLREPPNHVVLLITETPQLCASAHDLACRLRDIAETARQNGVSFLTLCQPAKLATGIGSTVLSKLREELAAFASSRIRLWKPHGASGDAADQQTEEATDEIVIAILLQYDGRSALTEAIRQVACEIAAEKIAVGQPATGYIAEGLQPCGLPDPDLIIFTGGLTHLHNSLLWQAAYAEFEFTDKQWNDIDAASLTASLQDYRRRDRRYGGLSRAASGSFRT